MKYTEKRKFNRERKIKRNLKFFRPLSEIDLMTIKLLKVQNIRDSQIIIGNDLMLVFMNSTKRLLVITLYDSEFLYIIGDQIGVLQEKVRQFYLYGKEVNKHNYRRSSYPYKLVKILRSKEINSVLKAKILQSNI